MEVVKRSENYPKPRLVISSWNGAVGVSNEDGRPPSGGNNGGGVGGLANNDGSGGGGTACDGSGWWTGGVGDKADDLAEEFRRRPPFREVPGEGVVCAADTGDGVITLTNYRIHVTAAPPSSSSGSPGGPAKDRPEFASSSSSTSSSSSVDGGGRPTQPSPAFAGGCAVNVPITSVETFEQRDLFTILLLCKDGKQFRVQFSNNSACEEWYRRLQEAAKVPEDPTKAFAFAHYAWAADLHFEELSSAAGPAPADAQRSGSASSPRRHHHRSSSHRVRNRPATAVGESCVGNASRSASADALEPKKPEQLQLLDGLAQGRALSWFNPEVARLRFDVHGAWRISLINRVGRRLSRLFFNNFNNVFSSNLSSNCPIDMQVKL